MYTLPCVPQPKSRKKAPWLLLTRRPIIGPLSTEVTRMAFRQSPASSRSGFCCPFASNDANCSLPIIQETGRLRKIPEKFLYILYIIFIILCILYIFFFFLLFRRRVFSRCSVILG